MGSELVGSELVGSELARVLWLPVEPIPRLRCWHLLFVRTLVGDGTPGTLRSGIETPSRVVPRLVEP
jgi:hypothetical protein